MHEDDKRTIKISVLISCACILQVMESLIPHPIPGMRLGLANAVTLIALISFGTGAALEVAVLRTVVSSFVLGTFLSPAFIMSFGGGVASALVMGGMYRLFGASFSLIGISTIGALSHMIVQFGIVYFLLGKPGGIFWLLPVLTITSLLTGFLNGLIVNFVHQHIQAGGNNCELKDQPEEEAAAAPAFFSPYVPGNSVIHRIPSTAKIMAVVLTGILIVVTRSLYIYAGITIFLAVILLLSGVSFGSIIRGKKFFFWIVLFVFILHTLSTPGKPFFKIGFLNFTVEGFYHAGVISLRLFLLMVAASILLATTSIVELTGGLTKVSGFLKIFGVSNEKMSIKLGLSLQMAPVFWVDARKIIKSHKFEKQGKGLSDFANYLGSLITEIYHKMELRSNQMEIDGSFSQILKKKGGELGESGDLIKKRRENGKKGYG